VRYGDTIEEMGMVRFGVVGLGMVRYGVVCCGRVRYGNTTRSDGLGVVR